MSKAYRKPNGEAIGTLLISIDDGFVEYVYRVRPRESMSISDVHDRICVAIRSRRMKGKIRR
jgi:hypothetical protein